MRIAQVSPLHESVPPAGYGGTERVVHWLSEELQRRGHEVTLFASGDSRTSCELFPVWPQSLRLSCNSVNADALHAAALLAAAHHVPAFDVIHSHIDWVGVALHAASGVPVVTTLHGRLDLPDLQALVRRCARAPLVSISDAQRSPMAWANWLATVHHGLPFDGVPFRPRGEGYLAFVGRISPEKRPDLAIRVAREVGIPIRLAAKINGNAGDVEYWQNVVQPLIASCPAGLVDFVGEIRDSQKADFMGRADALLMPIDWPEPFGLVAIEALSFGTPVIAAPLGALPEIVEDGKNGFLATGMAETVAAVRAIGSLSRAACRTSVRTRFSVDRMVDGYERVYRTVIAPPQRVPVREAVDELAPDYALRAGRGSAVASSASARERPAAGSGPDPL